MGVYLGCNRDFEAGKDKLSRDWIGSIPGDSVGQNTSGHVEERGYRHNRELYLGHTGAQFDAAPHDLCASTWTKT